MAKNSKNKYRTFSREQKLEEELQEIQKQINDEPEDKEEHPEPSMKPQEPEGEKAQPKQDSEEESFKKRYGDLRTYAQRKEQELTQEIQSLRSQLSEKTKEQIKFPKTEEEVEEWAKKYPDVAKIIETIAMKQVLDARKEVDTKFEELSQREKQIARQVAYEKLLKIHPDFPEVAQSPQFQEWVNKQPKYIYTALYENETDADAAARAVDLYKADMERENKQKSLPKEKQDATRDAARPVKTSQSIEEPRDPNKPKWTESVVEKLSGRDFEKYHDEIMESMRNPGFYDISGAAR